jgi:1-acyl-sn-glycerol-3-phosphate acyltransferase
VKPPPRLVRRLVVAPLVGLLEVVLLILSPLLLLVAALLSPFFGGWRPVRLLSIGLVYAWRHVTAMVACLWLWLRGGFGRRFGEEDLVDAHYGVMRWFVDGIYRAVVRIAHVHVDVRDSEAEEARVTEGERPVLVLGRHAGAGDSLLIIYELLCRERRRPRVVMKDLLRWDPLIDMLGERLPNRFVDPRGGDIEHEIATMAGELDARAALIIFPEGGNFTAERRVRSIERLEEAGHDDEAAKARSMRNVMAPRPGGSIAAIAAAPDADVVIVGHVGFPPSFSHIWRMLLPDEQSVELREWVYDASDLPASFDDRIDWLFEHWLELDAWVGERLAAEDGPRVDAALLEAETEPAS